MISSSTPLHLSQESLMQIRSDMPKHGGSCCTFTEQSQLRVEPRRLTHTCNVTTADWSPSFRAWRSRRVKEVCTRNSLFTPRPTEPRPRGSETDTPAPPVYWLCLLCLLGCHACYTCCLFDIMEVQTSPSADDILVLQQDTEQVVCLCTCWPRVLMDIRAVTRMDSQSTHKQLLNTSVINR